MIFEESDGKNGVSGTVAPRSDHLEQVKDVDDRIPVDIGHAVRLAIVAGSSSGPGSTQFVT